MQIHYHNRKPVSDLIAEELGATWWDDLDQMLARMDVISLNCPATRDTYHLLSAPRLALLQPHAIIVNTARGELIDHAALAEAVRTRGLRVGLDVFEHEPLPADSPLRSLDNVLLTPHIAFLTEESMDECTYITVQNVERFAAGRPENMVNPAVFEHRGQP